METIKTFQLNNGKRVVISYDEDAESPRAYSENSKICIRENRNYNFPNELRYNFDLMDEERIQKKNWYHVSEDDEEGYKEEHKKLDGYYVFPISCYIHGGVSFSLTGEGLYDRFDTSSDCGFIARPKKIEYRNGLDNSMFTYWQVEAQQICREEIEIYNQRMNGEVYRYEVLKPTTRTADDGRTQTERELSQEENPCEYPTSWWNYYSIESILKDFEKYEPKEI